MMNNSKISNWINEQQSIGNYSFSLNYLRSSMPNKTDNSIKLALSRLVEKNKIISIYKGFYIIIPPSYANLGILPPVLFLDDLMHYIRRPYYISLLSAAALHGSAHQQPQSFFVCTNLPSMRNTVKKGIQIKYVSKRSFPESHILKKKTESGYVNVSDPILTALDLVNYHKVIGGYNRAATIICELAEEIDGNSIDSHIFQLAPKSDIQRLGYLLEFVCNELELANLLFQKLIPSSPLRSYKLDSSKGMQKQKNKNRWKINIGDF